MVVAGSISCGDGPIAPPIAPADPADAVFVTSDIVHFWEAYDAGASTAQIQDLYLARASSGLRDFIPVRNVTAESIRQMLTAYPQYFAHVQANMLRLANDPAVLATIRANFETIEAIYPKAVYPPVTFLVGRFTTAGTVRPSGMIIGTEFYAIDGDTPLTELGAFQRANVKSLDSISLVVAHEHVHILQTNAGQLWFKPIKTLLDQSLMEGSADFVGELASGSHINHHVHAYGLANEHQLWVEFQAAMHGTNFSQWLYNQGTATGARPGDLGYFMGYRIAKAYYDKATDKNAAVRDIIEVGDAAAFLAASGYNP